MYIKLIYVSDTTKDQAVEKYCKASITTNNYIASLTTIFSVKKDVSEDDYVKILITIFNETV